jgi:hypothetical protein
MKGKFKLVELSKLRKFATYFWPCSEITTPISSTIVLLKNNAISSSLMSGLEELLSSLHSSCSNIEEIAQSISEVGLMGVPLAMHLCKNIT